MFRLPIKAVSAFMLNNKNEVLLLKRSNSVKSYKGYWQFPEGKVDLKESEISALKREIEEELGYKIKKYKKVADFSYIQRLWFVPLFKITRAVYKTDIPTQIKLSHEHSGHKWVAIDRLNSYKLLPDTGRVAMKLSKLIPQN